MSSVRGRRGPAPGRRAGGRGVPRATGPVHTGPVRTGARSSAPSRPGRRRTVRRPARASASRRRPLFTGRAVLLAALVLLLALTLAGPLRQFLAGRAELVRLAAERTELEQRAQELEEELEQQADPDHTARQARERLTYVLPGDRLVVVVDGATVEGDAGTLPEEPARSATRPPWYQGLMESVATADGEVAGSGG
ncbi:septum formation initiator family protein [Geodermatophilus sp. SYSU D00815]